MVMPSDFNFVIALFSGTSNSVQLTMTKRQGQVGYSGRTGSSTSSDSLRALLRKQYRFDAFTIFITRMLL